MSKSRSPTPTPNIYTLLPTNFSSSNLTPTSSRTPANDPATVTPATAAHAPSPPSPSSSASQLAHVHSFISSQTAPDDLHHHPYLIHRRPSPSDDRPAKRMRRPSSHDASSHSHSSGGEMADSEDRSPRSSSDLSSHSPPAGPAPLPLKKKRTRTLTTPHQSAVLHSLLAQSRFPTTAMREEVGRAIGLSARKVQIWFQNQRQKARRPGSQSQSQSQGDVAQTQTQHYSVYPVPHSYSGYPPAPPDQPHALGQFLGPVHGHGHGEPPAPVPVLLGPGMPGPSAATSSNRTDRGRPPLQISPTQYDRERGLPASAPFASRALPLPLPGPPGSTSRSLALDDVPVPFRPLHYTHDPSRTLPPLYDPSRTLPPLNFSHSHRGVGADIHDIHSPTPYIIGRGGSAPTTPASFRASPPQSAASFRTSPSASRSRSPSPPFAHSLPPPASYVSAARGLPPPFTLQPPLQWQRPPSGTTAQTWARRTDSESPPFRRELSADTDADEDTPRLGPAAAPAPPPPAPPSRAGRYDPVRAVFVPYSPTSTGTSTGGSSPAPSPPA